jgi:hypothetical protein
LFKNDHYADRQRCTRTSRSSGPPDRRGENQSLRQRPLNSIVLARQNTSGLCAVQRGASNALRLQSVGEHAGICGAVSLRTIVFLAALVASERAQGISGVIVLRHFKHVAALVVSKHCSVWPRARPCAQ